MLWNFAKFLEVRALTLRVFASLNVQNSLPHGQNIQDVADALDVSDDFVAPLQNACLELGWRTSVR